MSSPPKPCRTCQICDSTASYRFAGPMDPSNKKHTMVWLCGACSNNSKISLQEPKKKAECVAIEIPDLYHSASIQDCHAPQKEMQRALEWAEKRLPILVIFGSNGTGKTYLSTLVLRHYREKHPSHNVRFYSVSNIRSVWKQSPDALKSLEYRLKQDECILLDDIGIASPSEAFLDFLFDIVNYRYNFNKSTIYTTNLNGQRMREVLGMPLGSRLTSKQNVNIILNDKDHRS